MSSTCFICHFFLNIWLFFSEDFLTKTPKLFLASAGNIGGTEYIHIDVWVCVMA